MKYDVCPNCGAHLDHGEKCDCQDEKENAPDAAGAPSQKGINADLSVANSMPDVNRYLHLREICESTGAMGKEIALVVRETFPKFNRQLLAQCQAPEKYGVVIHPEGLRVICDTYGLVPEELTVTPSTSKAADAPAAVPAKKPEKRKLPRKLTFRMTARDYARLIVRVENDGFDSVQSWLYDKVIKLLEGVDDE